MSRLPEGFICVEADSPLMREMYDITIGDLLLLTNDIAYETGMDNDNLNEKDALIVMDAHRQCVETEGSNIGEAGLRATARGMHVGLSLIMSALACIKEAVDLTQLHEEIWQ